MRFHRRLVLTIVTLNKDNLLKYVLKIDIRVRFSRSAHVTFGEAVLTDGKQAAEDDVFPHDSFQVTVVEAHLQTLARCGASDAARVPVIVSPLSKHKQSY